MRAAPEAATSIAQFWNFNIGNNIAKSSYAPFSSLEAHIPKVHPRIAPSPNGNGRYACSIAGSLGRDSRRPCHQMDECDLQ
jgi:hypothetical protein